MVVVHKEAFVVGKADQALHPDHETREQVLRRHWWSITGLLVARERMAAYCPAVRAGTAVESLVIRHGEFTLNHRPLDLRILLAACHLCPDPEPLEPIVPTDPAHTEIQLAAMARALGRIRYLAATDMPDVADVFDTMDQAIADGCSIPVDQVPEVTGTAAMSTDSERALDQLLERARLKLPERLTAGLPGDDEVDSMIEREFQGVWAKVAELIGKDDLVAATKVLQHTSYVTAEAIEEKVAAWAHCLEAAEFRRNPPERT